MSNFVNLLDAIYPVDSIYITYSSISPAETIGGTWERITTYLKGDTVAGNTGGALKHQHKSKVSWWASYAMLGIGTQDTDHEDAKFLRAYDYSLDGKSTVVNGDKGNTWKAGGSGSARVNASYEANTKVIKTVNPYDLEWHDRPASSEPPYTTVFIWHRTA